MSTTVGSINERGYLKGFKRRGYTDAKCLLELVANSLDSIDRSGGDGVIRFNIGIDEIQMSDRGEGMDHAGLAAMFDLHRENHASDASRGVSGIGAKPALSNLSGDRNMYLLTHKAGSDYLKVLIPWGDIHREGRYTGMVQVNPMTRDEAAAFGAVPGTTIVFPYSDALYTLIRDNFTSIIRPETEVENTLTAPLDRIGVVFGRDAARIEYVHHTEPDRILPKYNYFADADFYTGVTKKIIEHWYSKTDGKDRFICENQEIVRSGRGYGKEPSVSHTNTSGYKLVGEFQVYVGLRREATIFDEANPRLPESASGKEDCQNAYNVEHLGSSNKEHLALSKLVRNGQTIGLIPIADMNYTTARGGAYSHFKVDLVQCEVRFCPISAQDNRQDNVMGIQENKNQFDGESLPLTFTRLVKAIRMQKAEEIWKYFEQRVAAVPMPPAPAPAPAPTSIAALLSAPAPAPASALLPAPAPAIPYDSDSEEEIEVEEEEAIPLPLIVVQPEANGAEVRTRLTCLVNTINPSTNYSPEIIALLITLEGLLI